ncbi:prepilin peptidase [archaeon]|nr:prepilin peptidase [archaeon]
MELILGFLILAYASFLDLKQRAIDDKSWMALVLLGLVFLARDYTRTGSGVLLPFAFSVGFTFAIVVVLYYFGIMGSGDCKIILGISALVPLPVHFSIFPIFSLGVFTNAIVISLAIPFFFFVYNLNRLKDVRSPRDFLVLFLGYKKKGSDIGSFEVALETEGGIKLFLNTKNLELGHRLSTDRVVWVTPAIPFVVLITAGFLISALMGDFISRASLIWSGI